MISYHLYTEKHINLIDISLPFPARGCSPGIKKDRLRIGLLSYGAGIRFISLAEEDGNEELLTLSYEDLADVMENSSLAGLTIGPCAGRMAGNTSLSLGDASGEIHLNLPPNEGTNQIHGGTCNLSSCDWELEELIPSKDGSVLTATFRTALPHLLEGWPGHRIFQVTYTFAENGSLTLAYHGCSDALTYINLTNHTYWKRKGLELSLHAAGFIENQTDLRPDHIVSVPDRIAFVSDPSTPPANDAVRSCSLKPSSETVTLKKEAVCNNGFLVNTYNTPVDGLDPAAKLQYPASGLQIHMDTDAPSMVVYTGDYLDNVSLLMDGEHSKPGAYVALEPQEQFPVTQISLCSKERPFQRTIRYRFCRA
ncbi:MAG: hypothetical protein K6A92_00420 [Lachnospiraceae bacterium]|nr:hypothetical protein [Lachnospiraceae bacterium]